MHCSVLEHGMTSLSLQTAVQKNEAKLSSFVQFENEVLGSHHQLTSNSNRRALRFQRGINKFMKLQFDLLKDSPCIMCVQYRGGCSVPWGIS